MSDTPPLPQYRLIKPLYVHDFYIEEGRVIEYDGVPNEEMEPLNEPAERRYREYIEELEQGRLASGRISRRVDEILFEEMRSRPREAGPGMTADNPKPPSTKVELPKYNKEVPPTGNLKRNGGQKTVTEPPVKVLPQPDKKPQQPIAISSINKETFNADE